ncbi:MAG: hypothetical protein D6755_07950 [Anaerolineae bacterium]|nr:MAG: hypothetical protein D6755_07950 [Anaerolineae bacterium]
MRYLIDGHNLIPHVPGLSLRAINDEEALVERLIAYARRTRHYIEVFFDSAPDLQQRTISRGRVKIHFITHRTTADAAIERRLRSLGKDARNWVVVTSDRQVQVNARAHGARVIPSPEFAPHLVSSAPSSADEEKPAPPQNPQELAEWLSLFGETPEKET